MLSTALSEALGLRVGNSDEITLNSIIEGEIRDVEVLEQIRSNAKRLGLSGGENGSVLAGLPQKLFGLIYLVAIVAAKLVLNQDISRQPHTQLASIAKSFVNEVWIDEKTKLLLERYLTQIASNCE